MDTLYDNLDNYNESKLIDELRNENLELKAKIEKYTVTLETLQKDFDKLAAEYKKLELNYSSLLKTARAEVERKTQIITNLNIEKDMMVLNAIQNKNVSNLRRNWARGQPNHNKANEPAAQNKKAANQPKSQNPPARKEDSTPPEDTDNTVSSDKTSRNIKEEKLVDRTSDAKENVREEQKDRPSRPASIRDRRKSLPATSFSVTKFSSDEEGEVFSPVYEPRNNPVSKETHNWRNNDRNPTKDNNQDHDPYNRNRNYDSDKYQCRDRFQSQRHRLSPERFLRRSKRDYSDRRFRGRRQNRDSSGGYRSDKDGERLNRDGFSDNRQYYDRGDHRPYRDGSGERRPYRDGSGDRRPYRDGSGEKFSCKDGVGEQRLYRDSSGEHRSYRDGPGEKKARRDGAVDYNKHRREEPGDNKKELRKRRLESPITDNFQQYQQKNHEEFERDYNDERNQCLEDAGNPKYHSDYEVPSNKRMRTDSYHRNDQDNKTFKGKALDQAPQPTLESIQSEDMSCQSPDYLTTELATVPKEIKLDAEVKIDDPREHSNKYTIRTEKGEKVLTTVTGRSVNLKPVNKSVWNIVEVEIPVALVRRPSRSSEDRINEVYGDMDVDNPASDVSSVESGETMSSLYDISTDPFHFCSSDEIRRKEKKSNQNIIKIVSCDKDIVQAEKCIEKSRSIEKDTTEMDKFDVPETVAPGKNVDHCHDQEGTLEESFSELLQTVDKGADKAAKDLQNFVKDSIIAESVEKPSNSEKETDKNVKENSDTKESLNVSKSKYKIPKLKNHQTGSRDRKLPRDKNVGDKLEVDNHDNGSLKDKSLNKDTVDHSVQKDNLSAAAIRKAMVEGDLALSDESSDMDLSKRSIKEIVEQSTCEIRKTTSTDKNLSKDSIKEDAECIKGKSTSNIDKQSDVDDKLSEDKTKSELNDISKKGKSKIKQKTGEETHKHLEQDIAKSKNSKPALPEKEVTKGIKSKFSDLFGENSSLITPEDLGLIAQDVRIESSSSDYFPIFEDAQDAADVGGKVEQTKIDLRGILEGPHLSKSTKITEENKEANNDHLQNPNKGNEIKDANVDTDKTKNKHRRSKSKDKENDGKPKETGETKIKCCKKTDNEHVSKIVEENETKANKSSETQQVKMVEADKTKSKSVKSSQKEQQDPATLEVNKAKHSEAEDMKTKNKHSEAHDTKTKNKHSEADDMKNKKTEKSKTKHDRNDTNEPKTSSIISEKSKIVQSDTEKNSTKDKQDVIKTKSKPIKDTEKTEANDTKINTIEVKRRKSKRHEEKSQLMIDTEETPQPAVITVEKPAQITFDNSISTSLHTYEPGVVKTVIISSGVQPAVENMPVNVISPILEHPVTPNIDSRQKPGMPTLSNSDHIHALATSTPAKEILRTEDVTCKTQDVSNTSNEQNSVSVDSRNDNDAPDVRIFVKRRRKVVKKTTPT